MRAGVQHGCLRIIREKLSQSTLSVSSPHAISIDEVELRKKYEYHSTTMSRELFLSIVHHVETESGADVCAVSFDFGNKTFLSQFNLTEDHHWIVLPCNDTMSDIDGEEKIFVLPDTIKRLVQCDELQTDIKFQQAGTWFWYSPK